MALKGPRVYLGKFKKSQGVVLRLKIRRAIYGYDVNNLKNISNHFGGLNHSFKHFLLNLRF